MPPTERTTAGRFRVLAQIGAASFVVLFQELALIRWLPTKVRALAYFPNVVLISAFLGLGVGCLLAKRRPLIAAWPVIFAAAAGAAVYMSRFIFTQESASEHLWLLYLDMPRTATVVESVRLPILVLFVICAATFVPLGQYVAARLVLAREVASSLWGYIADLSGSLVGVVAFSILSFSGARPVLWFTVLLAIAIALYDDWRHLALHLVLAGAIVVVVARSERGMFYSPYYAISVRVYQDYFQVQTNGSQHQLAAKLRKGDVLRDPLIGLMRTGYHLPYQLIARKPKRVLVLGAGTGNDVAVALDEGAEHVDAVEIDPVILELGRHHPDHPYSDRRVRLINTDARAFLNHSLERYDLVVFGTLDSMTRLSALSSVRLDNYVYTTDCLRAVRRHLNPGGGVAMYFSVGERSFIDVHIVGLITGGFGELPTRIATFYNMFDRLYLVGPAFAHLQPRPAAVRQMIAEEIARTVSVPTDDWPYLYLRQRGISGFYLSIMAAILAIAVVAVFAVSPEMRSALRGGFDSEMFLFGVAFLLIETRLVTQMNLVWGATWLTSAVVFGSILLMIIASTIAMQVRPIAWPVAAAGVLVALLATWAIPARLLVGLEWPTRLAASIVFIGAPVFFAACCFALLFARRTAPDVAFGWNMLGAVAGGLLEFTSMAIGIRATTLLAATAYLLAFLIEERRRATRLASGPSF